MRIPVNRILVFIQKLASGVNLYLVLTPSIAQVPVLVYIRDPNFGHHHDDVIKWKHFPCYWPFMRGIHRSRWMPLTEASDADLWCFSLNCARINGWVNNREAGDLRRHRAHYDVIVIEPVSAFSPANNPGRANENPIWWRWHGNKESHAILPSTDV